MPRTLSDAEKTRVDKLVEKTVEPRIKKLVDEFNKVLATHDIRVGVELQWFYEGISDAPIEKFGK